MPVTQEREKQVHVGAYVPGVRRPAENGKPEQPSNPVTKPEKAPSGLEPLYEALQASA